MQCCRLNAVEYYSANDAVLHLYYSYANTQIVYAINCNIHFGNDYTAISFTNNNSSPEREFGYAPDSFKLHYSGNKYGWCAQSNGYKFYPKIIRTQKPIKVRNLPSKYTQKTYNDTDSRDNLIITAIYLLHVSTILTRISSIYTIYTNILRRIF